MSQYVGANAVPHPYWQVLYNGVDITASLKDYVVKIIYEDCKGKQASTIELQYADPNYVMQNNPPNIGSTIQLLIGYQGGPLYNCGEFEIDQYGLKGPPDIFCVYGIEAGITTPLRTPNTMGYEGKTLTQIAQIIASKHGLTLVSDAVSPDVTYDRITQMQETDVNFLHRIANQAGYDFNIRGSQLVFYSRAALDASPPVGSIVRSQLLKFDLMWQSLAKPTYQAAQISYVDPKTGDTIVGIAGDPSASPADTIKSQERVKNQQEANLKAAVMLYTHNMGKLGNTLKLPGTMAFRAGNTANISGFGIFDKFTYALDKIRHTLNEYGWVTELCIRNVVQVAGTDLDSSYYTDTPEQADELDPGT